MSSSSSTKEAKAEAIMICLDTGKWMENTKSHMFKEQAYAMQYYCQEKLKSNPRTVVGVCASADCALDNFWIRPTRHLKFIMKAINDVMIGGHIRLLDTANFAHSLLFDACLGTDLDKRIVVFAGGCLYHPLPKAELLGSVMNDKKVACDVISFGDPYMDKRLFFDTLVRFTDNDGNSNICHVPPESSVRQALYRSQILIGSAQSSILPLPKHDKNKPIVIYLKAPPTHADDPKTDCPFGQRVLLTLKEKNVLYHPEFIDLRKKPKWFFKVNPHGILPLVKFSDGKYVSNSDVIVGMIEDMYPDHPLLTPPYFAYLGLKILPKMAVFLKSKDKNDDGLLHELTKLESHLLNCGGPYVNGNEITAVDLSLAPKLYHLLNACKLAVPQDLPHVQRYTQLLFSRSSFTKTQPSIKDVQEGWRQRLRIPKQLTAYA